MNIDKRLFEELHSILNVSNIETFEVPSGSLIYDSTDSALELVLLISGQVRIIDDFSTFSNQTVCCVNAPQIFGLSNLLDRPYKELVRANTECSFQYFKFNDIDPEYKQILDNQTNVFLDYSELPFLYQTVKQYSSNIVEDFNRAVDFLRVCQLPPTFTFFEDEKESIINNEYPLIYIDSPRKGFKYGQLLTPEICSLSFHKNYWPRILVLQINTTQSDFLPSSTYPVSPQTLLPDSTNHQLTSPSTTSNPLLFFSQNFGDNSKDGFLLKRATTRRDSYYSCLLMLNEYFNLPSKIDSLHRAADLLDQRDSNWLNDTMAILDKLGLLVRIVRIDPKRPLNIPIPCVWINSHGNPHLVTAKDSKSLTLIDPLKGRYSINHSLAASLLSDIPQLISCDIGLHTPTKKFDLLWLFPYIKRYRNQLVEVFAASFLNQIFALATPLLFQQIIDRVISKGASDALTPLALLMILCALLEISFSSLRTFQFVAISNRIDIGVGSAIVSRLLRLNARFFDNRPVGELSSRMGELNNIRNFLTGTALTVVLDAIFSLLYFSVMMYYSVKLTLIILLTIPPLLAVTVGITPITQRLIRRRAEASSRTQSFLVELLGGIQTIKLQNAEISSRKKWEDRHLETINNGFRAALANTGSSNALQLINKLSGIIVIGVGASLVVNNELSLGELIAFRIIAGYVTQPMIRLASSWQSFQEMSLSLERIGDIINQPLEVNEHEDSNISMPDIHGDIAFENVSYQYSASAQPILSSASLRIRAGSFAGFVGQSGCGKSTLLKLIPRLYRPNLGRVFIDNYDISKVDLYSLRSQIGFVPQDCMLFEGTIFSNISIGDPNTSTEDVVNVSKLACAHEFIMSLPYGYSTPIGEKGAGLSGGQRQRIALARMLLEKPNLVILDEATSALDVDTERQVVENLRNHFSNTTLLMITHRLSSLIDADQIIVMHSGRIDSIGQHADLMSQKGRYYALYQSQFGE